MTGLVAAVQRQQGQAQALQAYAVRVAAWGEAKDFRRLMDQLNGVRGGNSAAADDAELDAALAAFGLRAE